MDRYDRDLLDLPARINRLRLGGSRAEPDRLELRPAGPAGRRRDAAQP